MRQHSDTQAPHDLRRTCARLCRESGGALAANPPAARSRVDSDHHELSRAKQNLTGAVNNHLDNEKMSLSGRFEHRAAPTLHLDNFQYSTKAVD